MASFVRKIWIALQPWVKSMGLSDAFLRGGNSPALGLCVKFDRLEFVLLAPKDRWIHESIELGASTDLDQACQRVFDICQSVLGPKRWLRRMLDRHRSRRFPDSCHNVSHHFASLAKAGHRPVYSPGTCTDTDNAPSRAVRQTDVRQ